MNPTDSEFRLVKITGKLPATPRFPHGMLEARGLDRAIVAPEGTDLKAGDFVWVFVPEGFELAWVSGRRGSGSGLRLIHGGAA